MVVMVVDAVLVALRGELTRWLLPVASTVFVGRVTAEVRDALWASAVRKAGRGRVIQAWTSQGEQGFAFRGQGLQESEAVELSGLSFIAVRDAAWAEAMRRFGDESAHGDIEA